MERLTRRDLERLLEFVQDLHGRHDLDALGAYVLRRLPRVVSAEITAYNELNPRRRRAAWREEPSVAGFFPDARAVFERHMGEHPLVVACQRTGDGRARKISDFLTQRQFHRLGLYQEFFRRVDGEYQIAVALAAPSPLLVGITLNRDALDFSERERLLLDVLRPHLGYAYRTAAVVTDLRETLRLVRYGADQVDGALVVVAGSGRIRFATGCARRWLAAYFAASARECRGDRLPEAVASWLRAQEARLAAGDDAPRVPTPLVAERGGRRLRIRLVLEPDHRLLVLDQHPPERSPRALEDVGLTRREAEVLAWVAEGKTNGEIAEILGTRRRTVSKHLERVYPKLGVETRTAAAVRALELLAGAGGAVRVAPACRAARGGADP